MQWPQITFLILTLIGFGMKCVGYGVIATKNKRWPIEDMIVQILGDCFVMYLLYAGGFFNGGTP